VPGVLPEDSDQGSRPCLARAPDGVGLAHARPLACPPHISCMYNILFPTSMTNFEMQNDRLDPPHPWLAAVAMRTTMLAAAAAAAAAAAVAVLLGCALGMPGLTAGSEDLFRFGGRSVAAPYPCCRLCRLQTMYVSCQPSVTQPVFHPHTCDEPASGGMRHPQGACTGARRTASPPRQALPAPGHMPQRHSCPRVKHVAPTMMI